MHSPAPLARAARLLLAAACCTATVSHAIADEADDLAAAIQMFQESKYLVAQEALLNLDVEALSDTEKARRDEYLDRVQVALAMVEKGAASSLAMCRRWRRW